MRTVYQICHLTNSESFSLVDWLQKKAVEKKQAKEVEATGISQSLISNKDILDTGKQTKDKNKVVDMQKRLINIDILMQTSQTHLNMNALVLQEYIRSAT